MTKLDLLTLQVTDLCNFKCPYCAEFGGILTSRHGGEMTFDGFKKFYDDYKIGPRLGPNTHLGITGGEASLAKSTQAILELLVPQVGEVSLGTNAALPGRILQLAPILSQKPLHLATSFHPSHAKVEEFCANLDRLLRELAQPKLTFIIQVVLFPTDLDGLQAKIDLLIARFGKENVYLIPFYGTMHGVTFPNEAYLEAIDGFDYARDLITTPSCGMLCWAGAKSLWVTSTFEVLRCAMVAQHMPAPLPNGPTPCPRSHCDDADYFPLHVR